MPASAPVIGAIITAVTAAATTTATMVDANQQRQHAKGAAQAQEDKMTAQLDAAKTADDQAKKDKASAGSSTQAAALAALRASMSAASSSGGTILTSGQGTQGPAPLASKTLLGV